MTCSEILIRADGATIYTANRDVAGKGRDSLSVLAADGKGGLEFRQQVPAEVRIPRHIQLSPKHFFGALF